MKLVNQVEHRGDQVIVKNGIVEVLQLCTWLLTKFASVEFFGVLLVPEFLCILSFCTEYITHIVLQHTRAFFIINPRNVAPRKTRVICINVDFKEF